MQRPRVNGTLRSIAQLSVAYLLVVIAALIIGDTLGIQEVEPWVKNVAVTSSLIAGVFTLVILSVFDAV